MNGISVVKGFDRVIVGSSGHEQISCVDVNYWVFLIGNYQLLEVVESQVVVAKEICTFSSENVCLLQSFIKL